MAALRDPVKFLKVVLIIAELRYNPAIALLYEICQCLAAESHGMHLIHAVYPGLNS
jgi:hypothetical protein